MDDVLASIRRIVRAEKVPEDDTKPDLDPVPAEDRIGRPAPETEETPLPLTPDMRAADADLAEHDDGLEDDFEDDEDELLPDELDAVIDADIEEAMEEAQPERLGPPPRVVASSAEPAATAGAVPDYVQIDEMVRAAVLEALRGGAGEDLVREIIRDELINGEIGNNVSQNVIALIRRQLAKSSAA